MTNYEKGRRFEYERMKFWKECGHDVWRSAGSHGPFDLTTISKGGDIQLIQCKVVAKVADAVRMGEAFRLSPPLGHRERAHYHQVLEVKISGLSRIRETRI